MWNFFRIFYSKGSLKRKVLDSIEDMDSVVKKFCSDPFEIKYDGSYEIDPFCLIIWIQVEKDSTKTALVLNPELIPKMREVLLKNRYPIGAVKEINIFVESEETVERESGGSWYRHFNEN